MMNRKKKEIWIVIIGKNYDNILIDFDYYLKIFFSNIIF